MDDLFLEGIGEVEHCLVGVRHAFATDDGFEPPNLASLGIVCVERVGDLPVISSSPPLPDAPLHQPGQAGQHIHRREDSTLMKLPPKHDLSLRNVTGKVRYRVCDVVLWHRNDRQQRDRSPLPLDTAGALVDGCQIRIHVARVTSSPGQLLTYVICIST